MPNYQYNRGRQFEVKTAEHLAEHGAAVVRAAGSKGAGKMDLVAFMPDGRILIIQCKATGAISPGEWNRLVELAGWCVRFNAIEEEMPTVVPLVAMRGPRARPGQGWSPTYRRLAEPKVPRSRNWPWKVYDAVHGCDLGAENAPRPGQTGNGSAPDAG